MGVCCISRERNEYEYLIDDFFSSMSITNMSCEIIYNLIVQNLDKKSKLYGGDVQKFLNDFVSNYIVNGKQKSKDWAIEATNFLHFQFNNSNKEGFFNFTVILLFLSNDLNTKPKTLINLAKRFNIEIKNDKEMSKSAFEYLLKTYINFVSTDTPIFIKELTQKKDEFIEFSNYYFNAETVNKILNDLLSPYKNEVYVDINDFMQKYYFKLSHSEIRVKLYESKPERLIKA